MTVNKRIFTMEDYILPLLRWVHITMGSVGLIAYWVPIFTKKGAVNHRRYGRVFVNIGYGVVASSLLSLCLNSVMVLTNGKAEAMSSGYWGFMLFLAYLAIITFVILRYGMLVLSHKKDPTALDTLSNRALGLLSIAASIGIISFAFIYNPSTKYVLFSLSPVGILVGIQVLRYISGKKSSKHQWWYEHMGIMITAGIAFHTAFFAFGASRLFDFGLTGYAAAIPWILPTLIGVPASIIWESYYRKKFKDPKGKKSKAVS